MGCVILRCKSASASQVRRATLIFSVAPDVNGSITTAWNNFPVVRARIFKRKFSQQPCQASATEYIWDSGVRNRHGLPN